MKKIISCLLACVFAFTLTVRAESFGEVLKWMYDNKLTSYDTEIGFMPDDYLQRGQAAKFIAGYGDMISLPETNSGCVFSDVEGYDDTLTPFITKACTLGLLKGAQGKFWPSESITQAQALTMVIRIRDGFLDETGSPWYAKYVASAKANGIVMDNELSNTPDATPVARGIMAKWLWRSNNLRNMNPDAGMGTGTGTGDDLMTPPADEPMADKIVDPNAPHGYINYDEEKVTAALDAGQTVALYFFAGRCPNCQTLDRALNKDDAMIPADTVIFKVDYDSAESLKRDYNIKSQHTFVHLNTDGTAHASSNQVYSLDGLWAWLDSDIMM